MAAVQLKAKYAGSALGIWWAVVTPLLLAFCINFIFTAVFKAAIESYTLYLLAGILPWLFFNAALSEATNSFLVSSPIVKQGLFPREFVPIASVLSNFLNFLIGFIFLLPVFILCNHKVLGAAPSLLFILPLHFLFIAGLGLLFALTNVFLRDLGHLLSVGFMVWFWVTPVFYSLEMIPFPFRWICLLNPMTYYVEAYKQVLFNAKPPSVPSFFILLLLALGFVLAGYRLFLKKEAALLKKI